MNNTEFIRALSHRTGFAQTDIADVMKAAAEIVIENLVNGFSTAVFKGMVIYPATYKGEKEFTFPRARFGKFFKTLAPTS